jgi:hypothetical protein
VAKTKYTQEDDDLLAELGVEAEPQKVGKRTPRQERIVAGFEEIERFWQEHGRLPRHGEEHGIFERLYAVRLDKLRESAECRAVLERFDTHGLLDYEPQAPGTSVADMDDDALLAALGVESGGENDITQLKHVQSRSEKRVAEEVANRTRCEDFDRFKPVFSGVQEELKTGQKKTVLFKEDNSVQQGEVFIVGGQFAYVAEVGEEVKAANGEWDARLRVVYDNGTESNLLRRSLIRALHKDEAGRRIIASYAGPLFSDDPTDDDVESGTIYVLRSNSQDPYVREHREVLHKIGVTGGDIKRRVANAKNDPSFLMADVEVVATYSLANINRVKLENFIHKFFEPARLDVRIKDRFGKPVTPREWFLVPRSVIDEVIEKIKAGTIASYRYAPELGKLNLKTS